MISGQYDYRVIYFDNEKPGRAGVGFITNKKLSHQIVNKIAYIEKSEKRSRMKN
jgi:hypothetical protein